MASMVAMAGQSAEAASSKGRVNATASAQSQSDESNSRSDSDHAKVKQNKHKKWHKARRHWKSSAESSKKEKAEHSKRKQCQAASAKRAASEQAAKRESQAVRTAAKERATAFRNASASAVRRALTARNAPVAHNTIRAKPAIQRAAPHPILAANVPSIGQPIVAEAVAPTVISNPPATASANAVKPAARATKAKQVPQRQNVTVNAPPRRLAQGAGLNDGLQPLLVTAFVLVFGIGLVVGGTSRRLAFRTR